MCRTDRKLSIVYVVVPAIWIRIADREPKRTVTYDAQLLSSTSEYETASMLEAYNNFQLNFELKFRTTTTGRGMPLI